VIIALHHIQISIPKGSENEARSFYCGILGLTEIEKPKHLQTGGGLWLKLGELEIHLGAEHFDRRADTKAHLAYQVNDLNFWCHKLEQAGIEVIHPVKIDGMKRIQLKDPFFNKLEMLELV